MLNKVSHSELPGNEQHNVTRRVLREGIVVDAAFTSVISAEIETRCPDDEMREVGERGVKAAVLKADEGGQGKKQCVTSECPACLLEVLNTTYLRKETLREIETERSATPYKSSHFPGLTRLKFCYMKL